MKKINYLLLIVITLGMMLFTFGCGNTIDPDATTSEEEYQEQLKQDEEEYSSYKQQGKEIRESIEESQGSPMFHGDDD